MTSLIRLQFNMRWYGFANVYNTSLNITVYYVYSSIQTFKHWFIRDEKKLTIFGVILKKRTFTSVWNVNKHSKNIGLCTFGLYAFVCKINVLLLMLLLTFQQRVFQRETNPYTIKQTYKKYRSAKNQTNNTLVTTNLLSEASLQILKMNTLKRSLVVPLITRSRKILCSHQEHENHQNLFITPFFIGKWPKSRITPHISLYDKSH